MTAQSRPVLKSYFQRGLRPTQSNYADLIDSFSLITEVSAAVSGLAPLNSPNFITPNIGVASGTSLSLTSTVSASSFIPTDTTRSLFGTSTNNSALAGYVGEYIESVVTFASPTTGFSTGAAKNVTSISLTAGDWDITGCVLTVPSGGTTYTEMAASFSLSTNTLDSVEYRYQNDQLTGAPGNLVAAPLVRRRFSLSATTTVYLVGRFSFAVSTMGACGFINARRVR